MKISGLVIRNVFLIILLLLSERTFHPNVIIEGRTLIDLEKTTNYVISRVGEDITISCAVIGDDSQSKVWYKVNTE